MMPADHKLLGLNLRYNSLTEREPQQRRGSPSGPIQDIYWFQKWIQI